MAEILPIRPRTGDSVPEPPPPPDHLDGEASRIWNGVVDEWILGGDALPLLLLACEAFGRYREAAKILDREGPVAETAAGNPKLHPAHQVARDNLNAFRALFRQLNLQPPETA